MQTQDKQTAHSVMSFSDNGYTDKLIPVQTEDIELIWLEILPMLKRALDRDNSFYSSDDVKQLCMEAKAQLWFIPKKAVFVTRIGTTGSIKFLQFMWCAGNDVDDWLQWKNAIENWAGFQGCSRSRFYGRKGWKKKAPDYQEIGVVLEKQL